jgi:hypothetical protein
MRMWKEKNVSCNLQYNFGSQKRFDRQCRRLIRTAIVHWCSIKVKVMVFVSIILLQHLPKMESIDCIFIIIQRTKNVE